ncbi:hypothetical protein IFR05_005896 [Cadophora sp. M221]|nr:hypothetical protein IFR05_005896 [Cadophora sp. M221]
MLTSPTNRYVPHLMKQSGTCAHYNGNLLWAYRRNLISLFFPTVSSSRAAFHAYAKVQAQERVKLGTEGSEMKDFFYYLIGAKDPETGEVFTMDELWGEANLIVVAGLDTTSTALAGTFFYLTHNLEVLERAKTEVRTVFEGCEVDDVVSGPKLNACVYLRTCLEETLRMVPPVPGILPREVCARGQEIDGEFIPEGVDISVGIYSIHHNALYCPEPYAFRSERWITRDSIHGPENSKLYDGIGVSKEEVEIA